MLRHNPQHLRARVAQAWIDYIVDTKIPFGLKWLLGGGNRKRALRTVQEAVAADADFFSHTEAVFALWELQVRQKMFDEAVGTARLIARDFPENAEVARFLQTHAAIPWGPDGSFAAASRSYCRTHLTNCGFATK